MFGTVLAGILVAASPCAFGLNPSLDMNQYAHKAWKISDGFSKGAIHCIAQTPDGYLWLGTEFGLNRFDGVKNVAWPLPQDQHLSTSQIRSLLAARDGTLWIGTSRGLASWNGAQLTQYPQLAGQSIFNIIEDGEGAVWVGAYTVPTGRLCVIQNGAVRCYGADGSLGFGVSGLYDDGNGLWVGVLNGLWRWKPDPPVFYPLPGEPNGIQGLSGSGDGGLLFTMRDAISRLFDGKAKVAYRLPFEKPQARRLLRDRDGGLWVGTSGRGLAHLHQGRIDIFAQQDGLSGDDVSNLFEDREGNIWISTFDGLDRFRDLPVATFSVNQGLSNPRVVSVLAASDGSVWIRTLDGLNRWNQGQVTLYREGDGRSLHAAPAPAGPQASAPKIVNSGLPDRGVGSLYEDEHHRMWLSTLGGFGYLENDRFVPIKGVPGGRVHSVAGDAEGNIWIAHQDLGLFRLSQAEVRQIPWAAFGHQDFAGDLAVDRLHNGLWLGFFKGGVTYYADGQVRASYTAADGLGEGRVNSLRLDSDGALWAATESGLSRLKNGRVATLTRTTGLPCDAINWSTEDDAHALWLYTVCGLVSIARPELDAWTGAVDKDRHTTRTIRVTTYDSSDGVRSRANAGGFSPHVSKSPDGKLWFFPLDGVSVVDPRRLAFNRLPPPVRIEQIAADGKIRQVAPGANGSWRLPSLTRDLVIDYTGLSLAAPEKVRFRYKLEGHDRDWQDAGTRRQAFYNDLPPRNYRFRVIACNDSGVWNGAGAFLGFSVDAAYYQTIWFRLSCVAAFLASLAALYRLRLRQVERQFQLRLEERLAERTRIAQELHDTLLQGFQSAVMHVAVAANVLPPDSKAQPTLTRAIQLMRQVIDEGRNAVRGLRSYGTGSIGLEQALSRVQQEVAADANTSEPVRFRVVVEGRQRPLRPLLRDDVYRIGREAVINAFRHSRAQQIEVTLEYSPSQLCVRVCDDGCGIEPNILSSGRNGHWGLSGMQERADRIGGRLRLSSSAAAGTQIELSIPGNVAFLNHSERRLSWFRNRHPSASAGEDSGMVTDKNE
ncbi:MAG TPA: two-component regulator propeller domain-containing protein [Candidatus Acidoferrales bacterium]|jgi:signal transduction histidine kinase/ligand-binding sensor domain-containing protein|nr:two-component regulator propeller domain-containing protein [Candidatus Acidoferrales bacterium]